MSFNDEVILAKQEATQIENTSCRCCTHRHHHHKPNPHADHYIEAQHHQLDHDNYVGINRKNTLTTKPNIVKQKHNCCDEHPRRKIPKFEPLNRPYPKQQVMLLDIATEVRRSINITFKYNVGNVSQCLTEGDIVHAFYVSSYEEETSLVEVMGKISYIDYANDKIFIDFSTRFEKGEVGIFISALRFISTDIHEVPPFIDVPKNDDIDPDFGVDQEPDYRYDDDNEGIPSNTDDFFIRDDCHSEFVTER